MPDNASNFSFLATGIGSVPFHDVKGTCLEILEHLPLIPFWPQLVKRSYLEEMNIQFSEGLPLLEIDEEKRSLFVSSTSDLESELVTFYEHFMAQDTQYFSISENYAPGLYALLRLIGSKPEEGWCIKGQTVGPVTFAASITDLNGKSVLYNKDLLEAMVRGLAIKALWQVQQLESTGKKTIIFLDEPYLSSFGSAFSPVGRHEVIDILRTVIDYLRSNCETLIGIHCCGNTDWSMILEVDPDIISFDAFEYMDYFLLYRDDIVRFIERGGTVAWGIVPTATFTGTESVEGLSSRLEQAIDKVCKWGLDPDLLSQRSMLTSSCGMGTMTPESAKMVLDLLLRLSRKFRTDGLFRQPPRCLGH
jgi:hypothetical protein